MDILAQKLGIDPAEMRMRNFIRRSSSRINPRSAGNTIPATINRP